MAITKVKKKNIKLKKKKKSKTKKMAQNLERRSSFWKENAENAV